MTGKEMLEKIGEELEKQVEKEAAEKAGETHSRVMKALGSLKYDSEVDSLVRTPAFLSTLTAAARRLLEWEKIHQLPPLPKEEVPS